MFIVIFRAKVRNFDAEYLEMAKRLRELALTKFGCIEFCSMTECRDEVTISYWPSEDSISAWKSHPEHVLAQQDGREHWYESYAVQVAQVFREYHVGV